jgi:hypothetical protein
MVFENRELRRIIGPKRDGVTGGWRKLHNEELHDLYSSPSIIKIIKSKIIGLVGNVERIEKGKAYMLLAVRPETKRPLGRLRQRWVESVKLKVEEKKIW